MLGKENGHTFTVEDDRWASSVAARNVLHRLFSNPVNSNQQHTLLFKTGEKPDIKTLSTYRFDPKKTKFSEFSYNEPDRYSEEYTWTRIGDSNVQNFVKCLALPSFSQSGTSVKQISETVINFKDKEATRIESSEFKRNKTTLNRMIVRCYDYTDRKQDSISGRVSEYTAEIVLEGR